MRTGKKKVLIGSTDKCGTGVNVQTHLVAMHHVDCPWKPSSIEQREGRGIRQGNENEEVAIYRYVTKEPLMHTTGRSSKISSVLSARS